MRLLVIRIDGAASGRLLDAERLPAVARLMEAGWHGPLAGGACPSIAAEVAREGRRSALVAVRAAGDLAGAFGSAREQLAPGGADHVELTVSADAATGAGLEAIDAELGATLEALDGDTAVLVVSPGAAFVLASPAGGTGERRDATDAADLTRTLLELGGCSVAPDAPGTSLVGTGAAAPTAEDEERMMRDHLRGLGYL